MADPRHWTIYLHDYVPDSTLSLNGRRRAHWSEIVRLQSEARLILRAALSKEFGGYVRGGPLAQARLKVRFHYPTARRRDPDGLAGLAKPLIDELVEYGVLVDDNSDRLELQVSAQTLRGKTMTVIEIEELT